jgi:flagellar motor protein MotB
VELSKKRAQAVADFLVKKGYLKASKIVVDGKGGSEPIASNDTEEGKAKNRRVEITILAN